MSQGGLLFYDPAAGEGQFYIINNGRIGSPVKTFTDWRNSWTQIVPGAFGGSGFRDFLFYEGSTGYAEFYSLGAGGSFNFINSDTFPANLTQIIPGNFSGKDTTDLLFYNAKAGTGQFFTVTKGKISLLWNETGWNSNWKQILPTPAPIESSYYSSGLPSGVNKELY
jgi:hypothetical protein